LVVVVAVVVVVVVVKRSFFFEIVVLQLLLYRYALSDVLSKKISRGYPKRHSEDERPGQFIQQLMNHNS
jgi:hypothetical protein